MTVTLMVYLCGLAFIAGMALGAALVVQYLSRDINQAVQILHEYRSVRDRRTA